MSIDNPNWEVHRPSIDDYRILSPYISPEEVAKILDTPETFFRGHFEYPAPVDDKRGFHYDELLLVEPVGTNPEHSLRIAEDIAEWAEVEQVPNFDLVLAPNQPGVREIAQNLADLKTKGDLQLWEWDEDGRFGDEPVYGVPITSGASVLVFNGITQNGNCVGNRLPSFVEKQGGVVVGAATAFVGSHGGRNHIRQMTGKPFHTIVEFDFIGKKLDDCEQCSEGGVALPWNEIRKSS